MSEYANAAATLPENKGAVTNERFQPGASRACEAVRGQKKSYRFRLVFMQRIVHMYVCEGEGIWGKKRSEVRGWSSRVESVEFCFESVRSPPNIHITNIQTDDILVASFCSAFYRVFTMVTRKLIERVTARVFCHGPGGGNPVTVFASDVALSAQKKERLAKECEWESVMVSSSKDEKAPEMAFYMPSGEEVSFCAHAALGGAYAISQDDAIDDFTFQTRMTKETQHVKLSKESDGLARLNMKTHFEEASVTHSPALQRLLREQLGVTSQSLRPTGGIRLPTFCNSSIARPKTLVYVNSVDALHEAKTPSTSGKMRNSFASACGAIDDSTGIYLYTMKDLDGQDPVFECRQFPKASGYPEDPATGIAAAALSASLYHQGVYMDVYNCYQGTAMGRPSLIQVVGMRKDGDNLLFGLQGLVEIDDRDTIELEEDF